jgi:hypothetical protein
MAHSKRSRLIDEAADAYFEWREQSAAVEDAYRRWSIAASSETRVAFAAYVAALDREELASSFYARIVGRAAEARAA